MNKTSFALALALSVLPTAVFAQNANAPAPPSDAQRQAMHQTFEKYGQQFEQLRQQMRGQILSEISPVHLRAIGATIGELAIASNPDTQAAAKRIDLILSGGERSRIMSSVTSFHAQLRQLHEQMRSEMQSQMPAGQAPMNERPKNGTMMHPPSDAGTMLLMVLSPHPMMDMMLHGGMMMHGGMMPPAGAPQP
jgi:hypothetical protein